VYFWKRANASIMTADMIRDGQSEWSLNEIAIDETSERKTKSGASSVRLDYQAPLIHALTYRTLSGTYSYARGTLSIKPSNGGILLTRFLPILVSVLLGLTIFLRTSSIEQLGIAFASLVVICVVGTPLLEHEATAFATYMGVSVLFVAFMLLTAAIIKHCRAGRRDARFPSESVSDQEFNVS